MKESIFCDACGQEGYVTPCLRCGREFCYDCSKNYAVEYSYSVFFSGGDNGLYCLSCNEEMLIKGKDDLFNAYRRIKILSSEYKLFHKDFKHRSDVAEKLLKSLTEQ